MKKNEDLNSFIFKYLIMKSPISLNFFSMEEAIKNTRGKVKARFTEISHEQNNLKILKELVHEKKENIQ